MASLAINDHSDNIIAEKEDPVFEDASLDKKHGDVQVSNSKMKGQVIQKNYVLNDSSALKKKKRNESKKEPYNLGTEARDGSNMVIQAKTSFFEHVKAQFIDDILNSKILKRLTMLLAPKLPQIIQGKHMWNTL